jgi:hypothetical protein
MINLKQRLKISFLLFILVLFTAACSKKEKTEDYVAKVEKQTLTSLELDSALGDFSNRAMYKEEYINDWVEKEVLYQEAIKENVITDPNYISMIKRSERELARAKLIEKYLKDNPLNPTTEEVKNYFESYKSDFRLTDELYKLNIAYFINRESAVRFRNLLIESRWDNAIKTIKSDNTLIEEFANALLYSYQINPITFQRVVDNLLPNEVSIVFDSEPSKFVIVQFLEKYYRNSIPSFEFIQNIVRERYITLKQKELVKSYIESLISDYNVEIKR